MGHDHRLLTVGLKPVVMTAYVLLLLPIMLFFLGWLHLYIAIPASLLVVGGFVWIWRRDYHNEHKQVHLPLMHLLMVVCLIGVTVALAGVAGVGVSGFDAPWRNAIFHDLVDFSWPVKYPDGNALVYYCAFWLPAALVGKAFGWVAANLMLWLFIVAIIVVSYLLILLYFGIESPGKMWIACAFLLLWSGLTYLGVMFMSTVDAKGYTDYSLLTSGNGYLDCLFNGESFNFYYRSNAIALQMVFNQIPYWLVVPLMMGNRTAHSYIYLGFLLFPYSPWAFIGIVPLMVVLGLPSLKAAAREGGAKRVLSSVFSPANIVALLVILPVCLLFFLASVRFAASGGSGYVVSPDQVAYYMENHLPYSTRTGSFGFLSFDRFGPTEIIGLILFYLLEFGIYLFLIAPKYRRKPCFWVLLVVLMICPLIWVGSVSGRDFCMNASLPALFMLMMLVFGYVCEDMCGKPFGLRGLCMVVALVIAFGGTVCGELGQVRVLFVDHTLTEVDDSIGTLSDKTVDQYPNFLTDDLQDKAFFRYLVR